MEPTQKTLHRSPGIINLAEDYLKTKVKISSEESISERVEQTWFEYICCLKIPVNRVSHKRIISDQSDS